MLEFKSNNHLTLGIEVELQLINNENYDLFPKAKEILNKIPSHLNERIKPEIFLSMLEVNTSICQTVQEVERDLNENYAALFPICEELGVSLASTATHPFALYTDRIIYPSERYQELIDKNQWIARRLAIFGLHVHIGMKDGDTCIKFNNFLLNFLPHFLALSTSSPFWQGQDTGLSSCRSTIFESAPTAGHPCLVNNWTEFNELYTTLSKCKAIESMKDIWWDIRPSPDFGTLEIRICDGVATLSETLALVAFIHLLAHWYNEYDHSFNHTPSPPMWLIRENKWRASRHGLNGEIILNTQGDNALITDNIKEWLHKLDPLINRFNYNGYIANLLDIMDKGTSAARQLEVFKKTNSLSEVVKHNCKEFREGKPIR
jgi:carboxylate-amine ligase